MKNILTFGGGGGQGQVLRALKEISDVKITAVCPSTDSGGSTGILANEYGGNGYIGDLTRCIVALSDNEDFSRALMYRPTSGPIAGHTLKNLLFLALEKTNDLRRALVEMARICDIGHHQVLPATEEKTELCAELQIGNKITGETNIDNIAQNPLWNPTVHSIVDIYLKPKAKASSFVTEEVSRADYIVISPGDLYSSLIPTLLPEGMSDSIKNSKAKIVIILNIMTKMGETHNFTANDFIEQIEKYLGRKADYIICNNISIPGEVLINYSLENKVELGKLIDEVDKRIIFAPLASVNEKNQILTDPVVLRDEILSIFAQNS